MEKHCVSLEWAKKLRKADIKLDSEMEWIKFSLNENPVLWHNKNRDLLALLGGIEWRYPAPIAEELLEMLPQEYNGKDLEIIKLPFDIYSCGYPRNEKGQGLNYEKDKKLADALAKLSIKLKQKRTI
jgi:hypothetical protein